MQKITFIIKTVIMMTIKYGLQKLFLELTDNDGQNFLAGIVHYDFEVPCIQINSELR
jgi:hypothetical protein